MLRTPAGRLLLIPEGCVIFYMKPKSILRLSAVLAVCSALAAGAFSGIAAADEYNNYDYYDQDNYTDNYSEEDQPVEYIPEQVDSDTVYVPPEPGSNDTAYDDTGDYFNEYQNDGDEYYYDEQTYTGDEEQTEEASEEEEDESSFDPDQVSIDTKELTSKDWENIQNNLTSKAESSVSQKSQTSQKVAATESSKGGTDEFSSLKEKSEYNDTWIYLAFGIPLVLAGAAIIVIVIAVNVRASKKEKEQEAATVQTDAQEKPMGLEEELREDEKAPGKPKRTAFGAKHAAPVKTQTRDFVQKDLVDTLDEPTNIDDDE